MIAATALLAALAAISAHPLAASATGVVCNLSSPGVRRLGDYLGEVQVAGHKRAAWAKDALAIVSRKTGVAVGWLYIDQYGLRWTLLTVTPRGVTGQDLGDARLSQGLVNPVSGAINPKLLALRRCHRIE